MQPSEHASVYAERQRDALYEEMDVSDFWGRISRDDDPTMAEIADSPLERQAYANIDRDLKTLNTGTAIWILGIATAALLALFGAFSEWLLVTLIGIGAGIFLMAVAGYSGLAQKVFPAADALYTDSLQLGLLEAKRFPETFYEGMWENVREQVEEIKTWVPIAGIALVASLVIVMAFAYRHLDLYTAVPDGLIAVLSVLAAFLCLYAIAGYLTALDRLKRGARIIGRLVGQGAIQLHLSEMESLTIPETEDHTEEFEAIQAAEEEPEEDEEPMSEEEEIVYEDGYRPRPRVAYREPGPASNRPLIIQKREPVYPQAPYPPQPYMAQQPNSCAFAGMQPQVQPMVLQVQPDRNAQMLMTTQLPYGYPYPVQVPAPQQQQPPQQERVQNDELYRALTYRLHDLQSRLAWMRDRLETLEESPAPQPVSQPTAGAPASSSTQVHVSGGGPLADLERERLTQQIRHLEEEARSAREEQMTLVERIRTLQREGLANQAVKADLEAAQREKERLITRQKRLEGEAEKVRNDYEDALNKLSKQEREHQLAMQRLLERMQAAETEKERIAMEYEQLMRQLQAMPGPGETVDVGQYRALQQALEENQQAYQEAQGQVDGLKAELDELANREIPEAGAPLDEFAALQETLADREAALDDLRDKLESMDDRPVMTEVPEDYEELQQALAEKEEAIGDLQEQLEEMEQQPEPPASDDLSTGHLEKTGLDYQAYITLRDKFILDEVGRMTTSPLSRILNTKELDNTVVAILADLELTFHTVTAVRKKKSQYKDFYRKPRIEKLTKLLDAKLMTVPELVDDPSMRASLIEYGVNRPFYNSLIESVILDDCPPGSHLKVSRPSPDNLQRLRQKLQLEGLVNEAKNNPLQMVTAPPNSKEDAFFDIFYLLPKAIKAEVKGALVEAYIQSRYQAVRLPINNLKLWYAGFYVEPERMDEVRKEVATVAVGESVLPEIEKETVTTVVGAPETE